MDQLPVELLCMIFDRLDLEGIKNASLTCHRWEKIIFSGHYIKRFAVHVPLAGLDSAAPGGVPLVPMSPSTLGHQMTELAGLLQGSHRCYPNLTLNFNSPLEGKDHPFPVLFRSISCHMQDRLVVLKLVLKSAQPEMLEMVYDAVPAMSRLAALHIMLVFWPNPRNALHCKFPSILHSDTLRHLQLDESPLDLRDYSRIRNLWNIVCAKISFEHIYLPQLELLQLSNNRIDYDSLRALGTLKTLELVLPSEGVSEMLHAIVQHLPNLTVLKLNMSVGNSRTLLLSLHLLTTVRELVLEEGYFDGSSCSRKAPPVPQLQKLRFKRCELPPHKLPWLDRLFPNLKQLDIIPTPSLPTDAAVEPFEYAYSTSSSSSCDEWVGPSEFEEMDVFKF